MTVSGGDAIDSNREVPNVMTSNQLQVDVQEELKWDPKVDARHIAVTAHDGAVTLTGYVPTYFDKMRAVTAAEHVHGVKAVADELEVHLHQAHSKEDSDIADSVVHILEWNSVLWDQDTKVAVSSGRVTLTGEVDWNYQRDEAERAVKNLVGVKSVTNRITVKPRVAAAKVERDITHALARHAALDARQIHVTLGVHTRRGSDLRIRRRSSEESHGQCTEEENRLA